MNMRSFRARIPSFYELNFLSDRQKLAYLLVWLKLEHTRDHLNWNVLNV